jgi:hypothetical protein
MHMALTTLPCAAALASDDYFANIATDKNYDSTVIEHLIDSLPVSTLSREGVFSDFEVFKMLISVKKKNCCWD